MIDHIDGLIVQNEDGSRWLSLDEPISISEEFAREIVSENISDNMVDAALAVWVGGNQELFSHRMRSDCHNLMRSALRAALAQSNGREVGSDG